MGQNKMKLCPNATKVNDIKSEARWTSQMIKARNIGEKREWCVVRNGERNMRSVAQAAIFILGPWVS